MKKKYLSTLLLGLLVIGTTGTVTSCKDYDDDINALRQEITTNATDLTSLVNEKVSNLNTELAKLQSQQTALENALADAQTQLNAAIEAAKSSAISESKAYADIQAAAAQKAAAQKAAKANLDDAIAVVNAAIETANGKISTLESKVSTNEEQIAGLLEADKTLEAAIAACKASCASAIAEVKTAAEAAQTAADKAQASADKAQAAAEANAAKLATVASNLETVKSELAAQISVLSENIKTNAEAIAANKAAADAQFATVNSLIESNKTAIDELKSSLSGLSDKVAADKVELLEKITANSTELTKLGEKIAAVQSELQLELQNAVAAINVNIDAVKAQLTDYQTKNDAAVAAIQASVAANLASIQKNAEAIAAIQKILGKTTDLDAELKNLNDAVTAANDLIAASVTELANQIADTKNELKEDIKAQDVKVTELEDYAKSIDKKLSENYYTKEEVATKLAEVIAMFNDYATKAELSSEIKKVNEGITDLNDALTKLGETLRSEYASEVENLNTTISNLETKLQGNIDTTKSNLEKQISDLKTQIGLVSGDDSTTKTIQAQIDDLNEALKNYTTTEDLNKSLKDLQDKITSNDTEIDSLWTELDKTNQKISETIESYDQQIADMYDVLSRQLKSLVFNPTEYYQGIEAIGIFSYNYNAYSALPKYDAEKDQIDVNSNIKRVNKTTSVVPNVTVSYWLNPVTADVSTDLSKYSFIVNNATYTRAAKASDITILDVAKNDGKVDVTFKMDNANAIEKIPATGDGKVDVAALQYKYATTDAQGNTTENQVISDFAALKQYVVKDFIINKATAEGKVDEKGENHLATTAKAALPTNGVYKYPYLEVEYDSEEGIDLDKWINVHYTNNGNKDQLWGGQETIGKKNFSLSYELVGYIAAGHSTNESAHASIEGSILKPNGYKNETGRQIIGRTPLVRVTLNDENNSQVAALGYIIVKITDKQVKPVIAEADPVTDDYTVVCEGNALNKKQVITWEEIENKVLAELNVSHEEFVAGWTLDTKQYDEKDGKYTAKTTNIGTVDLLTEKQGYQTTVLAWTISNAEAYQLLGTSITTWVKLTPKDANISGRPVYIKLTWTPSAINKTPKATIGNNATDKKAAAWHAANSSAAGFDQLQIQVGNATDPNATCDYKNLVVANTFNVSPLDIVKRDLGETYKALADAAKVTYTFAAKNEQTKKSYVGVSENNYDIQVSNDGKMITVGTTTIATITPEDGTIYVEKNDVTKDIINKYTDVSDLANALTLTVKVNVTTCEPAANLIDLANNKIDVKVIKPLFVATSDVNDMQFNNFSTLTQPVKFIFKDFNGYTQAQFYQYSNKAQTFFQYYGITSIEQDGDIYTDYSGAKKKIDDSDIKVSYSGIVATQLTPNELGVVENFGTVTVEQVNQARTNACTIWVPVTVKYAWGELKTEIVINVKAAPTAAAKKF